MKAFEMYEYSPAAQGLIVYTPRLANKINKILKKYPDVVIQEGEEPVFFLTHREMDSLKAKVRELR